MGNVRGWGVERKKLFLGLGIWRQVNNKIHNYSGAERLMEELVNEDRPDEGFTL